MEQQEKQIEIDLVSLLKYCKKRIWISMAAVLVFAALGLLYSSLFISPSYVAETRLYVLNRSSAIGVQGSDYQISTYMLQDYQVLITGKNVTKEVIKQMNLEMTPDALRNKISVSAPEETRVLQINVTDGDPQLAADIANKVCEVAMQELKRLTDADAVHQVYEAEVPTHSVSPSVKKVVVLAAFCGLVVSIGIMTIMFVLDDSIHTEEDVERYLGLNVLGVIPESKEMDMFSNERLTAGERVNRK